MPWHTGRNSFTAIAGCGGEAESFTLPASDCTTAKKKVSRTLALRVLSQQDVGARWQDALIGFHRSADTVWELDHNVKAGHYASPSSWSLLGALASHKAELKPWGGGGGGRGGQSFCGPAWKGLFDGLGLCYDPLEHQSHSKSLGKGVASVCSVLAFCAARCVSEMSWCALVQ